MSCWCWEVYGVAVHDASGDRSRWGSSVFMDNSRGVDFQVQETLFGWGSPGLRCIPNLIFFTISFSDCRNLQWWLGLVWMWHQNWVLAQCQIGALELVHFSAVTNLYLTF